MDLTTDYLGLQLRSPLVASASPLSEELDSLRALEDAGASAVVLYSLFAEQLRRERLELHDKLTQGTESYAESLSYFPEPEEFNCGPEEYLRHISRAKKALKIPVIASLNAAEPGSWAEYAGLMQQAGADALELNIYHIPTDINQSGADVEQSYVDIVTAVRAEVSIPVAVKLSPYFSNFANMARRIEQAGADGLVLFNRFYQPDMDLESLEPRPNILLSTAMDLRLPLRWIAILAGRLNLSLAATSGIHRGFDAMKMLLAGADVTMLCSTLIRHGARQISVMERDMVAWMEEHEYESIRQLKGSLSQKNCPDPAAYERAQYLRAISSYYVSPV